MKQNDVQTRVQAHVYEIDRCNQRGGRMLSLIDLWDAGSVDLSLAAYLAAMMRSGASLLVGARPGGAGKTAVMCALLNFLPARTAIQPVAGQAALAGALRDSHPGETCYVAHEIGAGPYYAYLWGGQARAFFGLAAQGHTIASNLHADTLRETREQLCRENGVEQAHLDAVTLKVYLRTSRQSGGSLRRWVGRVYENDGAQERLLWEWTRGDAFARLAASAVVSPSQEARWAAFLTKLRRQNVYTILDVRRALFETPEAAPHKPR